MRTALLVIVFYFFILFGLRMVGKREFSQMSPLELITLLLIPELISQAILGEDFSATNAIIALATLFAVVFLSSVAQYLNKKVARVIEGTPSVLVHNGEFIVENMNKTRVSPDELFTEMHRSGFDRISEIKWAILETDGKISFVPVEGSGLRSKGHIHESTTL